MIIAYLESTGILSPAEIKQVLPFHRERSLKKNDFFVREGEYCREVAFVNSGIFRSFYTSDEGEETTYCFRFPGEFVAAYSAFITGEPSQENMQAISAATLTVIRKEDLDRLSAENPAWLRLMKTMAEQEFIGLEKRVFQLQRMQAAERYRMLLEYQPEYVQNIPLQYLASYLGISQRHLSRIRKDLVF